MGNHALFHNELWDWLLKMADDEEDPLRNLMKSAIEEVNNRFKSIESSEIEEETFRDTLPEGYTYNIEELSGDEGKFKAHFLADGITKDNINQWVAEYEAINGIAVKIKARKKLSNEYALRHYYRCHHNTRPSPSKDPQRKLLLNPSARVKNTNCPFQIVIKIDQNGCCVIDIEFEHNHSLETLEATNFRDISSDCVDKIYKLYESGHTPSTARQQYLKEIREACTNDLEFHKMKADRSVVPRRRDFNYLYTQFGNERFGGRGVMMFSKLVEKLEEYKTENPEATTNHQMFEGDQRPLIIVIVTPLMKRVHKEVPQSGELVFIDATSNTEEHNLNVFIMCTHSVAGALPLSILITSDERESTLKQGFEMLRSCLPDFAFHGRGPQLGPQVIITDNCKEKRNTLKSVWPSTILLLCIFHVLQQLWRWLHENSHKINQADRPHILSLFKQCIYAETEELFENCYAELLNDDKCKSYPNLVSYLSTLYHDKETFALCFRTELPVRGNHTNNFAEAQFLVLKDIILRRVKEYNVVGLITKITVELENHYKDKLLSVADGSFDGLYRRRFMGKGMDGSTGF